MSISNIRDLLDRYLSGQCSYEEQSQVEEWLKMQKNEDNEWTNMGSSEKMVLINSLYKDIKQTIETLNDKEVNSSKIIHHHKRLFFRFAAAAAIFITLATGAYFMLYNKPQKDISKVGSQKQRFKNDIPPGGNKAILTLADGSSIILDSAQNGLVANQGNTKVIKLKGKLAYNAAISGTAEIVYNTLSTPRGGTFQIVLPDGSMVWLNAASSLRFPNAFRGKERQVELTGEAYFEVVKNAAMPFHVKVKNMDVAVLGTHFNIMAYEDESETKTTLLEGGVKVTRDMESILLRPGQQAEAKNNGSMNLMNDVDLDDVIAWKNDIFNFDGVRIESLMRQISRWYDVDVIFNKQVDVLFYAEIPRSTKLSDVLKILELTGKVKFEIEGRKIIVMY